MMRVAVCPIFIEDVKAKYGVPMFSLSPSWLWCTQVEHHDRNSYRCLPNDTKAPF